MALISSSTEENTEFEVPKSFVSCLGSNETAHAYICKSRITVIRIIEDASLIEDAPQVQPSFPCNKLWVMMMGKLPNWRRTSSLEHFMHNFWSLSSQCLCIKVEFRNNFNATKQLGMFISYFWVPDYNSNWEKLPFSMCCLS